VSADLSNCDNVLGTNPPRPTLDGPPAQVQGTGGPQDPEVLYTPEAVRAELPGLRILRAEEQQAPAPRAVALYTHDDCLTPEWSNGV